MKCKKQDFVNNILLIGLLCKLLLVNGKMMLMESLDKN